MPGLQGDNVVAALGSPIKRSKLSLKFFQKKETKRALDFSEPQTEESKEVEPVEPETSTCDQVVPGPSSPGLLLSCEKKETLMPFVGFNNLGNTCYLNSILQVLYYCPRLRGGIKKLYQLSKKKDGTKNETDKDKEQSDGEAESLPAHMALLENFHSLITSAEQLQSNFLLQSDSFNDSELSTPPRKILHSLRRLNPMYEGYLQHDAQEVLQCILGYIQDACDTIRKEQQLEGKDNIHEESGDSAAESRAPTEADGQVSGKRKSDSEMGNPKKKPKSVKSKKSDEEEVERPLTRSRRKLSGIGLMNSPEDKDGDKVAEEMQKVNGETEGATRSNGDGNAGMVDGKRKKPSRLAWLRPSGKQPSIFSKFRRVGKISSMTFKNENKPEEDSSPSDEKKSCDEKSITNSDMDKKSAQHLEDLDLMQHLFQGRLVLRTRCLECESFTERREDFQDISVPVLEDQPSSPDDLSEVSPDPKPELKTLKWAIGQFASVERIFGEDKYFCETCQHYTEAERSLLFDKTPEVITIHLKRFSANRLDLDPYAGLSKVNTPLQTPLTLSLDEWCTRPSSAKGQQYQLFAVVMHSGVTISSGHYTAYIRMSDLKDVRLCLQGKEETEEEEETEKKEEAQVKEEVLDYDDGEVSFSLNSRRQKGANLAGGKRGGKKVSEGVGLLGGQRSFSSCEISSSSSKHAGKPFNATATEGTKRRKTTGSVSQNCEAGLKKEPKEAEEASQVSCGAVEATEEQALNGLLQYEGKWMLFDDSEVRLFEEEDFLRACSPDTCSSSTPYLLFYRRTPDETAS
ncbi:ubiquitin carboxyl-terminal hydrolase 1 [Cynoglossus semilaevis]|uniref:Ubiquitin carboxyl-terminal hydrolase n=1 Tax=Cynoglossus semilaevis TaxID=244447 RepID=A0A3P8WRZ0_CYNSE|nr:ubiquitin carboxyl-terminal hydrolase 1 [Cynoglossus semilaevis]XP_024920123.1 ubiquitin carboxyl-terminal hydrolase 1 [Cynoglossus semilaevis]